MAQTYLGYMHTNGFGVKRDLGTRLYDQPKERRSKAFSPTASSGQSPEPRGTAPEPQGLTAMRHAKRHNEIQALGVAPRAAAPIHRADQRQNVEMIPVQVRALAEWRRASPARSPTKLVPGMLCRKEDALSVLRSRGHGAATSESENSLNSG